MVANKELESLAQELWWVGVFQGAIAIFFGLAALFWPGLTLLTLLYLFGAFLIIMGVAEIIYGLISIGKEGTWWLMSLLGLAGLAVGVFLVRNPELSLQTFIIIVGLALIARGIIEGVRAFTEKSSGGHKVLAVLLAIIAILAGIFILNQPAAGGVAFVWILGLYGLVYGTLAIALSLGIRREFNNLKPA